MHRKFINMLCKRFPSLSTNEIEQAVLLAELRTNDPPFAWRIAHYAMLTEEQKEARYRKKLLWVAMHEPDECTTAEFDRMLEEEEWRRFLCRLPLPVRRLAEIAEEEAFAFEIGDDGMWCRKPLAKLRNEIKRKWIAWDRNHSEWAYKKTRCVLVDALRNHRNGRRRF